MSITWLPPDPYASVILSIAGGFLAGILAGLVVVGIEWAGRYCYARRQQRKAIRELRKFFANWELQINTSQGISDPQAGPLQSKEVIQILSHKERLRTFHVLMLRLSTHLSEDQAEEILLFVEGHEALINIIPTDRTPDQNLYDVFFRRVREEITWLKF